MLVLGIDPGLAITGYSLVRERAGDLSLLTCGAMTTGAHLSTAKRLEQLHAELKELLARYNPQEAAVERLFFSANAKTALLVGQACGVVLLTLAMADVPVYEYTPLQIKQAVTGYGRASKTQMQQMVKMLLGLEDIPQPDDAADAVAVAICHLHSMQMASMLAEYDLSNEH